MTTVASGQAGPSWEDQIVPTLRKRLESESNYLSNRLSSSQVFESSTHTPGPTGYPEAGPSSSTPAPRSRTKSGPITPPHLTRNRSSETAAAATSQPPSRIPTRPRSRSQLGSASPPIPAAARARTPPLPSNIPISTHRRHSPTKPTMSRAGSAGTPPYLDSRNSIELGGARTVEGFIKNELPPFQLFPSDEAMRIAEKGHDLDDTDWAHGGLTVEDLGGERRQRSITMRPEGSMAGRLSRETGDQLPNAGPSNMGLGLPSTRKSTKQARAASSRTTAPLSSSQASRSVSLNMLAANGLSTSQSSRLGVAAHFVPPETYTPPKGANWDEVVLPTVAKKLGLGEERQVEEGEDGALAVEWDRDGTPIKWVKGRDLKLDTSQNSGRSGLSAEDFHANTQGPASSAFSPTFDMSPDNSLRPPSMRKKKSGESIELTPIPIRTTHAFSTDLGEPSSPAPFASHRPTTGNWQPPQAWTAPEEPTPTPGVSRKPSVLKKALSPQASQRSLRAMNAARLRNPGSFSGKPSFGQMGTESYFDNPRAPPQPNTPGTTHMIAENAYRDRYDRNQNTTGSGHPPGNTTGGARKKSEEDVGKGCGCVLM